MPRLLSIATAALAALAASAVCGGEIRKAGAWEGRWWQGGGDRAQIEALLADMERAVLAGDAAAYLDLVVPADGPDGDPVFRKEQENWAADLLSDHGGPPAEFDLRLADDPEHPAEFWPLRAEATLIMTWRMKPGPPQESSRPAPRRTVSFPAVFKNIDGRWLFAGENWIVFEDKAAGVVVRAAEGFEEVARSVVEVWPEVKAHIEEGFEIPPPGLPVQEVKIYGDMGHLQASIYLSYVDSLAGWNEPGESIKILGSAVAGRRGRRSGAAALKTLLAHECGHVATYAMGPHATDAPWWALEGIAELSSEKFSPRLGEMTDRVVRRWAAEDFLAPWDAITDFRTVEPRYSSHVYRQGQHLLAYISSKHGRSQRNAWLRAMAQGRTLDQATRDVLNMSFADLDAAWRAELFVAAPEPPPAPTPTSE